MSALTAYTLGVITGLAAGVLFRDAWRIAHRKEDAMHKPRVPLIAWVLAFASVQVVLGAFLIFTRDAQHEFTACQADYNQQFASAYQARVDPSTKVADALHEFLAATPAILQPNPSPEDVAAFRDALDRYLRLYDELAAEREQNPYPPLPDKFCGPQPD